MKDFLLGAAIELRGILFEMRRINKKKILINLALLTITIFLCILLLIYYSHFQKVLTAKKDFDFGTLKTELNWIDKYGVILNEFPQIKNSKLWLKLNLNPDQDLIKELSDYSDQQHLLQLFELQLRLGLVDESAETLIRITSPERHALGKGLFALYTDKSDETIEILDKQLNWNILTRDEKTLRHLILAQTLLQDGDLDRAASEVQFAKDLESNNPGILIILFHIAVQDHEWDRASALSDLIDDLTLESQDLPYLTEKAIINLNNNQMDEYYNLLEQISKFDVNDDYKNYLMGLKNFNDGDLAGSKNYLENAYKGNLSKNFKADTKSMLDFINARILAEEKLQQIFQKE